MYDNAYDGSHLNIPRTAGINRHFQALVLENVPLFSAPQESPHGLLNGRGMAAGWLRLLHRALERLAVALASDGRVWNLTALTIDPIKVLGFCFFSVGVRYRTLSLIADAYAVEYYAS